MRRTHTSSWDRSLLTSVLWFAILLGLVQMGGVRGASAEGKRSRPGRLSLDGTWTLHEGALAKPAQIPSSHPPRGAIRVWEKTFKLAFPHKPKLAILRFEGISNQADVYLNGQRIGSHWAFTPFWFDVTEHLLPDDENLLRVNLDDRLKVDSVPGGPSLDPKVPIEQSQPQDWPVAWLHYGGIIRSVELILADALEQGLKQYEVLGATNVRVLIEMKS